jgi:hypothetical protein
MAPNRDLHGLVRKQTATLVQGRALRTRRQQTWFSNLRSTWSLPLGPRLNNRRRVLEIWLCVSADGLRVRKQSELRSGWVGMSS